MNENDFEVQFEIRDAFGGKRGESSIVFDRQEWEWIEEHYEGEIDIRIPVTFRGMDSNASWYLWTPKE